MFSLFILLVSYIFQNSIIKSSVPATLNFPVTYYTSSQYFISPPIPDNSYSFLYIEQLVAFHVIYKSDGTGNISIKAIENQIAHLNYAFSGKEAKKKKYKHPTSAKIFFVLSHIDYTLNDDWHDNCALFTYQPIIKKKLYINPSIYYNVYVCHCTTALGLSVIPYHKVSIYDTNINEILYESSFFLGTIIDSNLLTGSKVFNGRWSTGSILVHEAGHHYGLEHVYQGGCLLNESYSDNIMDTVRQSGNPSSTCKLLKGTKSCKKNDDNSNYMSINYGSCVSHFTRGQVYWMRNTINMYKKTLSLNVKYS